MRFPEPLLPARLVRRYKRFLADVILDGVAPAGGGATTVHCANPGAMLGLDAPGSEIWLSRSSNPARKLPLTWELIRVGDHLVGINTGHPNRLVAEAIAAGQIPELAGYAGQRREVAYGRNSRIDILLEAPANDSSGRPPCYVEVKNVHLRRATAAEFPDSVTARGAKHLDEMGTMVEAGARAVMVYLVQRGDCDRFKIAGDIDPAYARALDRARERGVEAVCHACVVTTEGIEVAGPQPLDL
jgi:sugar fermentation stimulation protein A